VLETIENEGLMQNIFEIYPYFLQQSLSIQKHAKVKGRGLMLGLEFDFPIKELRSNLIYNHHIFTGSSKNPNLLRILPPLTIKKEHIDALFNAIKSELS
jgi:acetylornithine aminotransferase